MELESSDSQLTWRKRRRVAVVSCWGYLLVSLTERTSLIIVLSGSEMITDVCQPFAGGNIEIFNWLSRLSVRFPFRTSLKSWILPIIKWIENKQTKPLEGGSLELQQLTVTGKIYPSAMRTKTSSSLLTIFNYHLIARLLSNLVLKAWRLNIFQDIIPVGIIFSFPLPHLLLFSRLEVFNNHKNH